MNTKNRVYLLLGSNLGNRLSFLNAAKTKINQNAGMILKESPLYEAKPWGFNHAKNFINQVILIETEFSSQELLVILMKIESELGRVRAGMGYGPRTIDIDILFYNSEIISTDRLEIPHPKLHERNFTLMPFADIAPSFVHPGLNKTISELLEESPDDSEVWLFSEQE
ncbi:MAG: 2-amino-4-hydroxy-6-hydroxymethyldihydropteridine diphosphokinase [Marinilabiliales bacterium]|nr:MAG: 2-amino-4-hydroxy-6-hydroxymethyldihydropteridine diphosphokinase [Marinilabiliales bacterium]